MDIKAQVEEIVKKAATDKNFQAEFQKNPEKAIENLAGIDIPDGAVDQIVAAVKAKMAGEKLGGIADGIKGIFG